MIDVKVNGHANGHPHPIADDAIKSPTITQIEDKPKVLLCCKRLPDGHGWCLLPDGHEGPCDGIRSAVPPTNTFGPSLRRPPSIPPPIATVSGGQTAAEVAQALERAYRQVEQTERDIALALKLLGQDVKIT